MSWFSVAGYEHTKAIRRAGSVGAVVLPFAVDCGSYGPGWLKYRS